MARAATIGNGSVLVGIDSRGQVRDFYHPYAGHSNHVSGGSGSYWHRIGVWVDGQFAWLEESSWDISVKVHPKQMNTEIEARNERLGVKLHMRDIVHNEVNVFLRNVLVTNEGAAGRTIKIFFAQQFRISESRRGDTGMYDPRVNSLIHYKGHNTFLIHATLGGKSFTDYSLGIFDIEGKDGTFRDAEDGDLQKNNIEHGSVDSVLGLTFQADAGQTTEVNYWIAVGTNIEEVHGLHGYVITERPERLRTSVENYWRVWVDKESRDLSVLPKPVQELYRHSLHVIRVHADKGGGIIASSDSDMLNQGRDNYSYVWPRDGVVAAEAMSRGGYQDTAKRFYTFVADLLEADGYLMHKYRVDGVLGSSWHPWVRNGTMALPIQEDETASIIHYLWRFYDRTHNIEFIESLYNKFIEPAAEFLCEYIDHETGLPLQSYDLWEEKYGTSTYTAASVYGGLAAAAHFSSLLGKMRNQKTYEAAAAKVKAGILKELYLEDFGVFVKLARSDESELFFDHTIDSSSLHGLVQFGVLDYTDPRIATFAKIVDEKLCVQTEHGCGYVRYEGDQYYTAADTNTPNPWLPCTLWRAQQIIAVAKSKQDLVAALGLIEWATTTASPSGILAEQVHPHTHEPLSASPLVWSHAEYVIAVDEYLKKFKILK